MGYYFVVQDEYLYELMVELYFNESVYCNGFDYCLGVGGWMCFGNCINEGYVELFVCIYFLDGWVVCQFLCLGIMMNVVFDVGGLLYVVGCLLQDVEMNYWGQFLLFGDFNVLCDFSCLFDEVCWVDGRIWLMQVVVLFLYGGIFELDVELMYGWNFLFGYFNQYIVVNGEIEIGVECWVIEGGGWCDYLWGLWFWQNIYFYCFFFVNFGNGCGFMLFKIMDVVGCMCWFGVFFVDGCYEEVLDMDFMIEWIECQDFWCVCIGVWIVQCVVVIEGEVLLLVLL